MTQSRKWFFLAALSLAIFPFNSAYAALNLILTQGVNGAIPIAIAPFGGQEKLAENAPNNIAAVVSEDLKDSGRFAPLAANKMPADPHHLAKINYAQWKALKLNNLVIGNVTPMGDGKDKITFALVDVYKNDQTSQPLLQKQLIVMNSPLQLRAAAHRISDAIFKALTGVRGIFSTHIAYVLVKNPEGANADKRYLLEVADADGYNPRAILTSPQPILSPAWSSDGKKLAYVSYQNGRPEIFVSTIATGKQTLLSGAPGVNGAPAWSPHDNRMALVLSKGDNTKIFVMNLATHQLQQITHGESLDTEPTWSPDGQSLLFTSDRGGAPQIYSVNLQSDAVERISYDGVYNAHAEYSPNGHQIVMMHQPQGSGNFGIGLQDLKTGVYLTLDNSWDDQSPSFAPNGEMVLYAGRNGGRGMLYIVSTDGRIKLRLPSDTGDVQEPAWSPFLS